VVWQSRRTDAYRAAFEQLRAAGQVFACACTRKEIADSALARDGTRRYPGTCRDGLPPGRSARAWRLRVEPGVVSFDDAVQGFICEDVAADVGDFVLLRADGLFAYQLAVVVDDAEAGVTEVVRGADLLDSTARQILLQRLLGHASPAYAHLPVASNAAGEKLSKQTLARAVEGGDPARVLVDALDFLGQQPPPGLAEAGLAAVWGWARQHWSMARVPRRRSVPAPRYG
jgi:glutamyl-Q tRNA(Asp) synthetase